MRINSKPMDYFFFSLSLSSLKGLIGFEFKPCDHTPASALRRQDEEASILIVQKDELYDISHLQCTFYSLDYFLSFDQLSDNSADFKRLRMQS